MMGMGDIIDKLFNYKDDEDSWSEVVPTKVKL